MSLVTVEEGGIRFRIDTREGIDLSIPIRFSEDRLTAFGASEPGARTYRNQEFVGDTSRGGSCNVQQFTIVPHCHGTHTECVGHIVDEFVPVAGLVNDFWIPATLLSIETEAAAGCAAHYDPEPEAHDALITRSGFLNALAAYPAKHFHDALILRTLPNDASKTTRHYTEAPFFSNDAMRAIALLPVRHLLVDLPSVDRVDDQGRLSNHRIFWQIPAGVHTLQGKPPCLRTITELIYVPECIGDGYYLLNLQIAPFAADAAPSRPIVFAVQAE